jgi:hypothetical protein
MRYMNRNLSWENGPPRDKTIPPFLRAKPYADGKYADVSSIKSWSDDLSGIRPGKNIEDVEREAIDKLFRTHYTSADQLGKLKLGFRSVREYIHAWSAPPEPTKTVDASKVIEATSGFPPVGNDLKNYSQTSFDNPNAPRDLTAEEKSKNYSDLHKYRPVEWNEPDGLQKPTPEELSKNYTDLGKYSPSKFDAVADEPATQVKYDDLYKYRPVEWNEPDGLRVPTAEELSKNYNDLHKYGAVHWNEPDGLRVKTPEELSKEYKDLDNYGPSEFNEPDGLRPLTAEEESKNYQDLDKYSEGFMAKNSVLEAQVAKQMDTTVRGNTLAPKVEMATEDYAQKYDDLEKYGPVLWNEPDGLRLPTPEELSKNYADLHLYAQYDNAGPKKERIHPEEASKQYEDLHKYESFPNAGPAVERIHPEVASKQYADLSLYPRAGFEEPATKEHVHPEELTKNYPDLAKYQPSAFDSAAKAYPSHPEVLTKDYDDLHLYKSIYHNEPDGQAIGAVPVKDGLSDYDAKHQKRAFATTVKKQRPTSPLAPQAHRRATNLEFAKVEYETAWDAESALGEEVVTEVGPQARKRFVNLEQAKDEYQTSWEIEADALQSPAVTTTPSASIETQADRLVDNLKSSKVEYESEWDAAATSPEAAADIEVEAQRRLKRLEKSKAKTEEAFDAPTVNFDSLGIETRANRLVDNLAFSKSAYESEYDAASVVNNTDTVSRPAESYESGNDQVLKSGWDVAPAALEHIEVEAANHPESVANEPVYESGWDVTPAALESIETEAGSQLDNKPTEPVLESGWDVAPSALDSIEAEAALQPETTQAAEPVLESGWDVAPAALESIEAEASSPAETPKVEIPPAAEPVLESGWDVTPAALESIEQAATSPPKPFQDVDPEAAVEWDAPEPVPTTGAIKVEAQRREANLDDAKAQYETAFEHQVDFGAVPSTVNGQARREMAGATAERDEGASSMDESFPAENSSIRDAMQRHPGTYGQQSMNTMARIQAETDPYSKSPQGLEISYDQETCGKATWPTMVRHYRSEAKAADAVETATAGSDAAAYVVLAFDPLTQSVNVAETSSTVEHVGNATTPAEAILRLSNPSKFFPHFKPLEEQGYEIVSGRGDVLIFRKVRAAAANAGAYDPSKHMRKKRSLGKKLVVGTASVAGAAYAIGVFGEYVATRGAA